MNNDQNVKDSEWIQDRKIRNNENHGSNNRSLLRIKSIWHELELKINLSLREIATKMKIPYSWVGACTCEECKNAKQMQGKGKGKGKKSKKS